jgi:hypothetical protein
VSYWDYAPSRTLINNKVKNGDWVDIEATFSETLQAAPGISIGTQSGTMTHVSGDVYTYRWNVSQSSGSVNVQVTATDQAGNGNTITDSGTTFVVDNNDPYVTNWNYSESPSWKVRQGDVVNIRATFNEPLKEAPDITVGAASGTMQVYPGIPRTYEYDWTVPSGNTTVTVQVTATDEAENTDTISGATFTIDNTAPTMSSLSVSGNDAEAYLDFNEDIYGDANHSGGVSDSDLTITFTPENNPPDGDLSSAHVSSTVGSRVTVTLTWNQLPRSGDKLTITVSGANEIFDEAGNPLASGASREHTW